MAVKPLGGEKPEEPLPVFLTKKERKRVRKAAREEKEREKRDKMMMGLIPAPEPKFKLSNFMKILGDQAVADPSKVRFPIAMFLFFYCFFSRSFLSLSSFFLLFF